MRGATRLNQYGKVNRHISTHAPLAGRDLELKSRERTNNIFQPTRPLRGATISEVHSFRISNNFNPRAPCGARLITPRRMLWQYVFQPTRPLRGATEEMEGINASIAFQPTRPLRGATVRHGKTQLAKMISTHAPLAGRDPQQTGICFRHRISTHAPLAGRD